MPAKSKKPSPKRKPQSKRKTKAELTKPFDPKVWSKAAKLAERYTVILALEEDDTGKFYFGHTLEMPYVMSDGKTRDACMEQVLQATTLAIATMYEDGQVPPQPATDEKRSTQVNVRLTQHEKFRLEEAARRAGFRGLSDFVRNAALDKAG